MHLAELKGPDYELAVAELDATSALKEVDDSVALVERPRVKHRLALTHRLSRYLGRAQPTEDAAVELVRDVGPKPEGSFRVRARATREVDVDTQDVERRAGAAVAEKSDAEVDLVEPDVELRLVYTESTCYLGWLETETEGYSDRQPTDKPFFKPGAMSPELSRALTNIAGAYDGARLLDPTCGAGGSLVEAALAGARVVGVDSRREMAEGSRANLAEYVEDAETDVAVGDAAALPFSDDSFDCVVTDLPYGRQSPVDADSIAGLHAAVLREARRVSRGRVVAVADADLRRPGEDVGLDVELHHVHRVHRSLDRHVHVFVEL
ncbi:MAG: methyltransferase domain-containing protein [Halobacteriota archaeon]